MSKAEERIDKAIERALEVYPVVMTTLIPADDEHPVIEQDCNKFKRAAFVEGYHQAEKDLELTVDDLMKIDALLIEMWNNSSNNKYQEILKRFKDFKERKENGAK